MEMRGDAVPRWSVTRVHWNMRIGIHLGRRGINSIRDRVGEASYLFVTNSDVRLGLGGCAMRQPV